MGSGQQHGIPIRHRHYIDINIQDTHAILDQLMVDAAIRVVGEIRYVLDLSNS